MALATAATGAKAGAAELAGAGRGSKPESPEAAKRMEKELEVMRANLQKQTEYYKQGTAAYNRQ
eukprot:1289466-Pyramimonas_sp.AAC.1